MALSQTLSRSPRPRAARVCVCVATSFGDKQHGTQCPRCRCHTHARAKACSATAAARNDLVGLACCRAEHGVCGTHVQVSVELVEEDFVQVMDTRMHHQVSEQQYVSPASFEPHPNSEQVQHVIIVSCHVVGSSQTTTHTRAPFAADPMPPLISSPGRAPTTAGTCGRKSTCSKKGLKTGPPGSKWTPTLARVAARARATATATATAMRTLKMWAGARKGYEAALSCKPWTTRFRRWSGTWGGQGQIRRKGRASSMIVVRTKNDAPLGSPFP